MVINLFENELYSTTENLSRKENRNKNENKKIKICIFFSLSFSRMQATENRKMNSRLAQHKDKQT